MSRFASSGVLAAAILSLGLIGCGSDGEEEAAPETVEFLTFWGKGGELEALDALIDVHTKRRPNATVTKSIEEDSASYTERLTQRMNERNPPDTFQSNQGTRLTRWVLFNDTDATQSKLEPVTSLSDEERGNIHEALLNVNSFNGDLYAVPVGIIRQNSFYYNKATLEDNGISVDDLKKPGKEGVQALLSACETLAAANVNCLAMGNKNKWILDMFLWENLFPAMVGKDYYESFWRGEQDPAADVQLEETLTMMLELYKYIDPDNTEIDFPESLERLYDEDQPKAAMVQMGDWGTGMYKAMEAKFPAAADVGVMMFPGTSEMFMFSSDVVPISKGTANTKAAQEFLKTIATKEAQTAFNVFKGSLPARQDADITGLSAAQQETFEHLTTATHVVPVVHGLKPDTIMGGEGGLGDKAAEMVAASDIDIVRSYIVAHYEELKNYANLGR